MKRHTEPETGQMLSIRERVRLLCKSYEDRQNNGLPDINERIGVIAYMYSSLGLGRNQLDLLYRELEKYIDCTKFIENP